MSILNAKQYRKSTNANLRLTTVSRYARLGFSLLEILISLAIFSIAMLALFSCISLTLLQQLSYQRQWTAIMSTADYAATLRLQPTRFNPTSFCSGLTCHGSNAGNTASLRSSPATVRMSLSRAEHADNSSSYVVTSHWQSGYHTTLSSSRCALANRLRFGCLSLRLTVDR